MSSYRQTIGYYLRAAVTYRWLLLAPAVLLFAGAAIYTTLQDDVYEGSTVLLPQMARPSDGVIRAAVVATARDMLRGTQDRLYRYDMITRVINELDLYPELRRGRGMEAAVARFREKLKVVVNPRSNAIVVSFRHSGGKRPADVAADTVNHLVQMFVKDQRQAVSQKAVDVKSFILKKRAELDAELEAAERKLEQFRSDHLGELPEDRSNNLNLIVQAENRIESCLDRQQRNRDEIDRYTVASFELKRNLDQPDARNMDGDFLTRATSEQLAFLEAQLAKELNIFHEDSDKIKERRSQIAETKKRLTALENKGEGVSRNDTKVFYQWLLDTHKRRQEALHKDSEVCERRIAAAQEAIAAAQAKIQTAAQLETDYSALIRAVDDCKNRRRALVDKQETVTFTVDFQDHDPSTPIEVEQLAFASQTPVGPRRLVTSLAGLFAGLGIGMALVFARAKFDRTFRHSDDLRLLLPGAVLVTVPEVSGAGVRLGRVFGNVVVAMLLVCVFVTAVTVLGIRIGWWGEVEMIRPLLDFPR